MARARTNKETPDRNTKPGGDGATTGYEADLWRMADTLRGSMDAAIAGNLKALGFGE